MILRDRANIFFIVGGFFYLVLIGCPSKATYEEGLRDEVRILLAKDVRSLSEAAINSFSFGIGSGLLNIFVTKEDQDSILLSPLLPYINNDLGSKNINELEDLIANPASRLKFVGFCLYNNKEAVTNSVSATFKGAEKLVATVIDLAAKEK